VNRRLTLFAAVAAVVLSVAGAAAASIRDTSTPPTRLQPKPTALLRNARLAGQFDVSLKLTDVAGIDVKRGEVVDAYWVFRPRCATGACGVRMTIPPGMFGDKTGALNLKKSGKVYSGTGTAYLASCLVTPVAGPMSVKLTATAGRWIDGRWRVTRVAGTFRYTAAATGMCRSSLLVGTARGTLEQAP
jgi:hypothetical protein